MSDAPPVQLYLVAEPPADLGDWRPGTMWPLGGVVEAAKEFHDAKQPECRTCSLCLALVALGGKDG